jgi:hypothetical protein
MSTQKPTSNDPHDKFIKQLVPVVLKKSFDSETSVSVELAEELAIDVLCKAVNRDNPMAVDPELGLLGRLMAVHPTIIVEHYSDYLSLENIDSCVLRSGMYWERRKGQVDSAAKVRVTKKSAVSLMPLHLERPFTWILTTRCGENSLRRWGATPATEFGEHVYWLGPPGLSIGVVDIESLPDGADTVVLKLMGKAASARQAFEDLGRLNFSLELRSDIISVSIKHCIYLEQFKSELTQEALDFMTYVKDVEEAYQQWVMERRAEGKIEGIAEGKLEGKLEQAVTLVLKQLTRKFGSLSPDVVERINELSLDRADELGVALMDFGGMEDLVGWLGNHVG